MNDCWLPSLSTKSETNKTNYFEIPINSFSKYILEFNIICLNVLDFNCQMNLKYQNLYNISGVTATTAFLLRLSLF